MYLMYTLDEQGNRVYTLKVSTSRIILIIFICIPNTSCFNGQRDEKNVLDIRGKC